MTVIEFPTPDPRTFDDATRPFAEAISERYAIKRMIGRGGMGVVYLARDLRLDRLVAIKTLPPSLAKDTSLRERFMRETRTAGAMSHPNIVPIHGADEIDGHVFFVMSFVDGDSLAAHVRANGRLAPRTVAAHLRDVASALEHAHAGGIIHRDIKAENILVDRKSGRALVTDFGIARLADATPLTGTGQLLGTVYYVSPEQVSGNPIDIRSDLYSLGVVGFLALAGRFPFESDVASAVLVAHVTKTAPPVASVARDVPSVLAAIIDRCLMKDPAHRFADAGELMAALDGAIAEIDRTGVTFAPPSLVSDTEAHAVWKRAAELQAQTGIVPRPAIVPRPRDEAKDRARASGYGVDEVKAAANEAGIPEPYIEHALMEHGLRPSPHGNSPVPSPQPVLMPAPVGRRRGLAGVPLTIHQELRVDGEIDGRDFERVLHILRESMGRMGKTAAFTRELAWRTGMIGARLAVGVVPRDGVTTIIVERSMHRRLLATLVVTLSVGTFIGMGVGAMTFETFGRDSEPIAILLGFASGLYATLFTTRFAMRRFRARLEDKVRTLTERIGAKVRESIG